MRTLKMGGRNRLQDKEIHCTGHGSVTVRQRGGGGVRVAVRNDVDRVFLSGDT